MTLRYLIAPIVASTLLLTASPRVTRTSLAATEKSLDHKLERDVLDGNLFSLTGMTRGVYLEGYGVVFSAEVNLVPQAVVTPFTRPEWTPEERARIRQRKLERVAVLRGAMREMLVSAAGSLDSMPAEEQVVMAVSLLNSSREDTAGIPWQIVMQAQRKTLLDFQTQRRDRAELASLIRTQEF